MKNEFEVLRWAEEALPNEACGVTIDGVAFLLENVSSTPRTDFVVRPEDLSALLRMMPGAWDGVWHSHPKGSPEPSDNDIAWHPDGKALYIVAGGKVHRYEPEALLPQGD